MKKVKNNIEQNWKFWKAIICNKDGSINLKQLKKELSDFSFIMEQIPIVYSNITGNRLSKLMYYADTVIKVANEYQEELIQDLLKEEKEEILSDIEKIRSITYTTFREENPDKKEPETMQERRIEELENRIRRIDDIIYPKYYNLDNKEN